MTRAFTAVGVAIFGAVLLTALVGPAAAPVTAQIISTVVDPLLNEQCAAFPQGGRHRIQVPGPIVDPTCEACTPVGNVPVPRNSIFDFTDRGRATCEWKDPRGGSLNLCQSTSVCAPGFTRIDDGGVVRCQGPDVEKTIDCPVQRRSGDSPRLVTAPAGPSPIPVPEPMPPACLRADEMKDRLEQHAADLQQAIEDDASVRGPAAIEAGSAEAGAIALYASSVAWAWTDGWPKVAREAAVCDDVDPDNKTAMADCNDARSDREESMQRGQGLAYRQARAHERADRALGVLREGSDSSPLGTLLDAISSDSDEAQKNIDACMAEIQRAGRR